MAVSPERIDEIRRQLQILEPKAQQATEPVVKSALESRIRQLRTELGETEVQSNPEPSANVQPTAAQPSVAQPVTSPMYHVLVGTDQRGPMAADAVIELLNSGQIGAGTLVWTAGMPSWQPLSTFEELSLAAVATRQSAPDAPQQAHAAEPAPAEATPTEVTEAKTEEASEATDTGVRRKKHRPEDDVVVPPLADAVQLRKAEEVIRSYRSAKLRGQDAEAARLLASALQAVPGSPDVQEAVGDDYLAKSRLGEARMAYYIAHRLAPKNVQIEKKYATAVLRASGGMSFESAILLEAANTDEAKRAMMFSAVVPGAGQLALEDYVKGGVMLGIHILCFAIAFTIFRHYENGHTLPGPIFWLPVGAMLVNWAISVNDLSKKAKGTGLPSALSLGGIGDPSATSKPSGSGKPGAPTKPSRPIPPMNLPFE